MLYPRHCRFRELIRELFISPQTVPNHIKNIYDKLQVYYRAQVVAKTMRDRLIQTGNRG
jgi:DNA-binding NarL/FixJ family response regulator